jgi:hypothetical protein
MAMWEQWWVWLAVASIILVAGFIAGRLLRVRRTRQQVPLEQAKRLFHLRREWLEAHFLTLAAASGKPRGLAWVDCEFDDDVSFARDRTNRELRAFVGATVRFTAVEGGGMEGNENVGRLRAATAVFLLDGDQWVTQGRAIFNLSPGQAIAHFREELELVE